MLCMMPIISKLLRTPEADLKPAECMVKGEYSKLIALKSCWENILVYAPHTLLCKDFALFIEKQAISQELFTEILLCIPPFCGSASNSSSLKDPSIYPLIQGKHLSFRLLCMELEVKRTG